LIARLVRFNSVTPKCASRAVSRPDTVVEDRPAWRPRGGEAAFFDDLQENGDVAQQRDTNFPDYYSASC
jgi:hypothetical protein